MNLRPVYPPNPVVMLTCIYCGARGASDAMLADLDGVAFRDYYHHKCALAILAASTTCHSCGDTLKGAEGEQGTLCAPCADMMERGEQ